MNPQVHTHPKEAKESEDMSGEKEEEQTRRSRQSVSQSVKEYSTPCRVCHANIFFLLFSSVMLVLYVYAAEITSPHFSPSGNCCCQIYIYIYLVQRFSCYIVMYIAGA